MAIHAPDKSVFSAATGSSLVGILVSIGLLGILAVIMATMFSNQFKVIKTIEQRGEQEDLRNLVRIMFNCENTVIKIGYGVACPTGKIKIYRHSDSINPFLKNSEPLTEFGPYKMSAACSGTAVKKFQFYFFKGTEPEKLLFAGTIDCPG